jgi:HEAT repeats
MPVPLIAMLAASLHEAQAEGVDPASTTRAISLLARAAEGTPFSLSVAGDDLLVNDVRVDPDAPGVVQVHRALRAHQLTRLQLPRGMDTALWHELVEMLASAPGLYPTAGKFAEALHVALPGSAAEGGSSASAGQDSLSHPVLPSSQFGLAAAPLPLGSPAGERSDLSARLDPLIAQGREALDRNDLATLAETLLQLAELERESGDSASVAAERRRLAPPPVLEAMAHQLPDPSTPLVVGRALRGLGAEAADAIVDAMRDAVHRPTRRAYVQALAEIPESTATILAALSGTEPRLLADVADAAGRRALNEAVPALKVLLKHHDEEVRTAAWHALEQIATPEARRALEG